MTRKLSVLLTTEGTYPHHNGGVSTWCNALIKGLEWVDFTLLPIMMNPHISVKYNLPPNVTRIVNVPLWGTEEPAEYILEVPFSRVYLAKRRTNTTTVTHHFLPLLRQLIHTIYAETTNAQLIGETLYEMHLYFQRFDYNETFKARPVWETFKEEVLSATAGKRDHQLPSLYDLTEALRWLYRFLISLNANPPRVDVTHATAAAFCGIPCIIAKIRDSTPFLLTEHGTYIREQYLSVSRMKTTFYAKDFLLNLIVAIARTNYHFADQISPVCSYNKRWEIAHGAPEGKIQVIYNGVDPNLFSPKESYHARATIVVSAARIDPLKDIETLIRAAHRVKYEVPNVQFLVYGGTNDREYYQQCLNLRASLNLEKTIIFPGHTTTPWDAYNQADIVALTSISEAFPYAVIEAMACGRPVVASDVGGIKEALEGCGILTRPRQSEELADSLLTLLHDQNTRTRMGQGARDRVLDTFTLEQFIQKYGESYLRLKEQRNLI